MARHSPRPQHHTLEPSFRTQVVDLLDRHRPSRHPFFARLAAAPRDVARDPEFLEELYKRYQAAMHASRVMVYFLPHLDSIDLRVRKVKVLLDDDAGEHGDTHHYQLRRTWTTMLGRPPRVRDDEFGDLDTLISVCDVDTSRFIWMAKALYPASLGAWVTVEGLAHDWIGALLNSLLPHFPNLEDTDYFQQNYNNKIELEHAEEALDTVCLVLARRPNLQHETIHGVEEMGRALDALWSGFDRLLSQFSRRSDGE